MMDGGCYCAHALRFFPGQQPRVLGAWPRKLQEDWFIDCEMKAAVEYPGRELTGALHASLVHKGLFPVNEVKVIGSKWVRRGWLVCCTRCAVCCQGCVGMHAGCGSWLATLHQVHQHCMLPSASYLQIHPDCNC
jgi:hypothetical protein